MTVAAYHNDRVPRPTFVAMLDVLGFTKLVSTTPLAALVTSYEGLLQMKRNAARVPVLAPGGGYVHQVGTTIFSDTIVLWCDDDPSSLDTFLTAVAALMARAIDQDWLLRGGVAYGDAVMCKDIRIFVGQPIIDAYHMEQTQQWVGAALHPSCLQHPTLGPMLRSHDCVVRYPVPTGRRRDRIRSQYAVHWGPFSDNGRRVLERREGEAKSKPDKKKCHSALVYLRRKCRQYSVWHSA